MRDLAHQPLPPAQRRRAPSISFQNVLGNNTESEVIFRFHVGFMLVTGCHYIRVGPLEKNRRARFYQLTRAGHKLLAAGKRDWEQTGAIIARFSYGTMRPLEPAQDSRARGPGSLKSNRTRRSHSLANTSR